MKKSLIITMTIVAIVAISAFTMIGVKDYVKTTRQINNIAEYNFSNETIAYSKNDSAIENRDIVVAKLEDEIQVVNTNLSKYQYPIIIVEKNKPVQWNINADSQNLNFCNNEIVFENSEIKKKINTGANSIEFTFNEEGVQKFSCWMGMLNSAVVVVEDINNIDYEKVNNLLENNLISSNGACGFFNNTNAGCCNN